MRDTIRIKARAKINLVLKVVGKREDGYHELDSVMQSVGLSDELTFKRVKKKDYLKIITDSKNIPCDERNIVYRVIDFMLDKCGIRENGYGVFVNIEKSIPVSAGLGGGSADCAAAITGTNLLFGLGLSDNEKAEIGLKFGADVPFCLFGGLQRAKGVGENLFKIESELKKIYTVIAKPPISVSTANVFKQFSMNEIKDKPNIDSFINAVTHETYEDFITYGGNDLETVTAKIFPVINEIKDCLYDSGAFYSIMTGSGSTVLGLFTDKNEGEAAISVIKSQFPQINEIFITYFADSGLQIL